VTETIESMAAQIDQQQLAEELVAKPDEQEHDISPTIPYLPESEILPIQSAP
jgi:hypothetical protein